VSVNLLVSANASAVLLAAAARVTDRARRRLRSGPAAAPDRLTDAN